MLLKQFAGRAPARQVIVLQTLNVLDSLQEEEQRSLRVQLRTFAHDSRAGRPF